MNVPARWTSLEMILYDVLYISYLVPAARVRPRVPSELPLDVVEDDKVFLSVVMGFVREAKAARLPSPRFTYYQLHVCTYVRHPRTGEHATYHLLGGMTAQGAARVARALGMNVMPVSLTITPDRDERLRYRGYHMRGRWDGEMAVDADEVAPKLEALPPFPSAKDAVIYLTDSLVTLFGPSGRVRAMSLWHPRFQPRVAQVSTLSLPILKHLDLLDPEEMAHPHNVLLVPREHRLVHLPPRRVKGAPPK